MIGRLVHPMVLLVLLVSLLLAACSPAAAPPAPTAATEAKPAPSTSSAPAAKAAGTPAPAAPTPKPEKLKIATPTVGLVELAQQIARKKGFFTQENLDVEITQVRSEVALKATVAGELDFIISLGSTIRAAAQGVPMKALMGTIVKPYHTMVVRPEIKEGKDLKGKLIAADAVGSTTEYMVRRAAVSFGLDPDKEITTVALAGNPERLAALKAGSVQATVLEALYAVKAENEGMKRLVKMADIMDMPVAGLSATNKMIKERPDLVLRVVRATVRGLKFIKDPKNKDELIDYLVKELNVTREEATVTYPDILRSFSDDGMVAEKSVMDEIAQAVERAGAKADTTVADVFDYSFVKKVKEER